MRGGSIPGIVWLVVSIGKSSVPKTTNNRKLKKKRGKKLKKEREKSAKIPAQLKVHRREDFYVI